MPFSATEKLAARHQGRGCRLGAGRWEGRVGGRCLATVWQWPPLCTCTFSNLAASIFRFSLRLASLVKKLQNSKGRDRKQFFSHIFLYKLKKLITHSDSAQDGESEGIFFLILKSFPD